MAPLNKSLKNKSRLPKMTTQTLLDFDLGESSSDSDFRIEDHAFDSDDDCSVNSKDSDKDNADDDEDSESDYSESNKSSKTKKGKVISPSPVKKSLGSMDLKELLAKAVAGTSANANFKDNLPKNPICCACLGDRSDDANEIVECDGCGVSVHEGCYGVSDTASISSTNSSCSTEPWFCEACKAGIIDPSCELCPNKGGIFKETEVGRWVHLICALYVPGVAFGEVDHLSSVTLFEMQYSKWGAKQCTLCEDDRYARTGVCIGCDAGMCKTFFHVTCAQAAGFLSEPHSDEADHADPFYAHCKIHSDKSMIKHRKMNFNVWKMKMEYVRWEKDENKNEKQTTEQLRIQRKLAKHQLKYKTHKENKNQPWVPTQKIPRLLTTSATAVRRLHAKADVMGIDTDLLEFKDAQVAAITDIRKKWHIPPAFSVEFVAYYLDRINRLKELKTNLEKYVEDNTKLLVEQTEFREEYDSKIKVNAELLESNSNLKNNIQELQKQISALCPNKQLMTIDNIGRSQQSSSTAVSTATVPRPMSVPTAAARKMGVGFPLNNLPGGKKGDTNRILSTQIQNKDELVHDCGICKRCNDQHLLAKCDTCHLYYHLGCLNPPLTRHPKTSKLYGWQCSECDKSDDSDVVVELPPGPRRSRTKFSKDGKIVPVDPSLSIHSTDGEGNASTKSDYSPGKRKISSDRRSSFGQPLSPKSTTSTSTIVKADIHKNEMPFEQKQSIYNGQINFIKKDGSPPKSPKKINATKLNRKMSQSPPKMFANSFEKIDVSMTKLPSFVSQIVETVSNPKKPIKKILESAEKCMIDPLEFGNNMSALSDHATKNLKASKKKNIIDLTVDPLIISPSKLNNSVSSLISIDALSSKVKNNKSVDEILLHKQNRKRRKDKHKNRYQSDSDRSPSKEHKRKRKKKSYDIENPKDISKSSSVPKIKIKFKTLPLPGEAAPEPHFFYVSADMVRPTDASSRPTSVETVDDSITINNENLSSVEGKSSIAATSTPLSTPITPSKRTPKPINRDSPKSVAIPAKLSSPRRPNKRFSTASNASSNTTNPNNSVLLTSNCSLNCTICQLIGTVQNSVQCDECHKVYHFTCLDPPVKKTPKIRGYSWHCADCDPTDNEET